MASYDGFRRDSNLSPGAGLMGTPSPGAGPIHNMPINSFRHSNNNSAKARLAMDGGGHVPQGFYHHQTPPPMPHGPPQAHPPSGGYYGNNKITGGAQLGSNEYYGKYEIEFNHHHGHHPGQKGVVGHPPNHMDHHHGNNMQQSLFVNHQGGHRPLTEFNNKSGVQFNNQTAAYYNNNGGNPHGVDGPEINGHPHLYQQQQQFHHQNYHGHNNNFEGMDAAYYHHHHHGHGGAGPGHGHPGGHQKASANFYEANNNSINYQHEYGEMSFPGANAVTANAAASSPMHHHHPVGGPAAGGAPIVAGPQVGNNVEVAPVYVPQQQQQHQYGFEGPHIPPSHGHVHGHHQQMNAPGIPGEGDWGI